MAFGFFKNVAERFFARPVDWDELEELMIRADLGLPTVNAIHAALREHKGPLNANTVIEVTRKQILAVLPQTPAPLAPLPDRPKVILVVGVNGTGKTTSTAKLASHLHRNGHTVLLAAADTFRAAAIEQLGIWAGRIGVEMIKGQYGADPAALCYDALQSAKRRNIQFLLCDTAGRLHTKDNLMQELNKVKRSLAKLDPTAPQEALLVVDATTGSNALVQAREFHKAVGLTGILLTKIDGSGKGGAAVAIARELGIPTRYIGTGEKIEDFSPFDPASFVEQVI